MLAHCLPAVPQGILPYSLSFAAHYKLITFYTANLQRWFHHLPLLSQHFHQGGCQQFAKQPLRSPHAQSTERRKESGRGNQHN